MKKNVFTLFSHYASRWTGSPWTFALACLVILAWGISGPLFKFSDTWQLIINSSTSIVTFLMVFLIQNTQNRDTQAMQLKLDELIRNSQGAHLALLDLEELSDKELTAIREKYIALARKSRLESCEEGNTGCPDIELGELTENAAEDVSLLSKR